MSEFRQDLSTKDWTLISQKPAGKSSDFKNEPATPADLPEISDKCPFCEGKSNDTPNIIKEYQLEPSGKSLGRGGWQVRVVPNKFNVLDHSPDKLRAETCEFYCSMPAVGDHEVIFTYPHNKPIALQETELIDLMLVAYLDRMQELRTHEDVKYMHIIQNHGGQAGASLVHPHSQIFTTPFVPERIQEELNGTRHYHNESSSCLYCDVISYEIDRKVRVVLDDEDFLVISPYAAKVPYQLRILPKRHSANFDEITDEERKKLAEVMKDILGRLYDRLNNPSYNYYIHTLPFFEERKSMTWNYEEFYHWHLVIIPRFSKFAGFELGTEVYVNTVSPEQSAERLR